MWVEANAFATLFKLDYSLPQHESFPRACSPTASPRTSLFCPPALRIGAPIQQRPAHARQLPLPAAQLLVGHGASAGDVGLALAA